MQLNEFFRPLDKKAKAKRIVANMKNAVGSFKESSRAATYPPMPGSSNQIQGTLRSAAVFEVGIFITALASLVANRFY
tara:strand:- start:225 stop:458 length:234 start_codon:yes stop_codon:yes gene_type:complete